MHQFRYFRSHIFWYYETDSDSKTPNTLAHVYNRLRLEILYPSSNMSYVIRQHFSLLTNEFWYFECSNPLSGNNQMGMRMCIGVCMRSGCRSMLTPFKGIPYEQFNKAYTILEVSTSPLSLCFGELGFEPVLPRIKVSSPSPP